MALDPNSTAPAGRNPNFASARTTPTPLPGSPVHAGPGIQIERRTNVSNVPATTRSGALAADQTVRPINRRDGSTNARVLDRQNIDAATYAYRYQRGNAAPDGADD